MEPSEFQGLLAGYPKVRDRDFRWVQAPSSQSTNATVSGGGTDVHLLSSSSTVPLDGDFFAALVHYLKTKYSHEKAEQMTRQFKKAYEESLKQLSLDDIERIAKQLQNQ